jgi:hypothetical protein
MNHRLRVHDYAIMAAGYVLMTLMTPENLYRPDSWTMGSRIIAFEMAWMISLYFVPSSERVRPATVQPLRRRLTASAIVLTVFAAGGCAAGAYRIHDRNNVIRLPSTIGSLTRARTGDSLSQNARGYLRANGFLDGTAATYSLPNGGEVLVAAGRLKYGTPEEYSIGNDTVRELIDANEVTDVSDYAVSGITVRCANNGALGGTSCGWTNGRAVVVAFATPGIGEYALAQVTAAAHKVI